jgi:DNA-directed RNA polymerase sigma subunit (sigma70/sigma32)
MSREICTCAGAQGMNDSTIPEAVKVYLRKVNSAPRLTREDLAGLLLQLRELDAQAELANKRLIEGYLYLVVAVAEKYSSSGVPTLELLQEGNVGLMRAIRTFSGKSDSFELHATACIERAVLELIGELKPPSAKNDFRRSES